uniref:Uncharacterized protein n=1 Tax=Sphaerodactylus townsendi TaxID=933632 RepID=A0ACB8EQS4_9SAUR
MNLDTQIHPEYDMRSEAWGFIGNTTLDPDNCLDINLQQLRQATYTGGIQMGYCSSFYAAAIVVQLGKGQTAVGNGTKPGLVKHSKMFFLSHFSLCLRHTDISEKKGIETRTAGHLIQLSEKRNPSNVFLWKARIPPVHIELVRQENKLVMNALTMFAAFSQSKHSQCRLSAQKVNSQEQPDSARSPFGTSQFLAVPGTCVPSVFNDTPLTPEGKGEGTVPHHDFHLTEYVQKVGRKITESLNGGLEEQVRRSTTLFTPFSETIAAAQILDSVFSPGQLQSELPPLLRPPEHILGELLGKSPAYKRHLHFRSQPTLKAF